MTNQHYIRVIKLVNPSVNYKFYYSSIYVPISISLFVVIIVSILVILKIRRKKNRLYRVSSKNENDIIIHDIKTITEKNENEPQSEIKISENMGISDIRQEKYSEKKNIIESSVNIYSQNKYNTKNTFIYSYYSHYGKQETNKDKRLLNIQVKSGFSNLRSKNIVNKIVDDTILESGKNNFILEKTSVKRMNHSVDSKLNAGFIVNSRKNSLEDLSIKFDILQSQEKNCNLTQIFNESNLEVKNCYIVPKSKINPENCS